MSPTAVWFGPELHVQDKHKNLVQLFLVFLGFLLLTMNKVVVCLTQPHLLKRTKKWDVRTKQRMFCFVFCIVKLTLIEKRFNLGSV